MGMLLRGASMGARYEREASRVLRYAKVLLGQLSCSIPLSSSIHRLALCKLRGSDGLR